MAILKYTFKGNCLGNALARDDEILLKVILENISLQIFYYENGIFLSQVIIGKMFHRSLKKAIMLLN